ncbi:unknown [Clostridium sp. CAG:58]|nr:unknown [Clostridium sp. CAG:58]
MGGHRLSRHLHIDPLVIRRHRRIQGRRHSRIVDRFRSLSQRVHAGQINVILCLILQPLKLIPVLPDIRDLRVRSLGVAVLPVIQVIAVCIHHILPADGKPLIPGCHRDIFRCRRKAGRPGLSHSLCRRALPGPVHRTDLDLIGISIGQRPVSQAFCPEFRLIRLEGLCHLVFLTVDSMDRHLVARHIGLSPPGHGKGRVPVLHLHPLRRCHFRLRDPFLHVPQELHLCNIHQGSVPQGPADLNGHLLHGCLALQIDDDGASLAYGLLFSCEKFQKRPSQAPFLYFSVFDLKDLFFSLFCLHRNSSVHNGVARAVHRVDDEPGHGLSGAKLRRNGHRILPGNGLLTFQGKAGRTGKQLLHRSLGDLRVAGGRRMDLFLCDPHGPDLPGSPYIFLIILCKTCYVRQIHLTVAVQIGPVIKQIVMDLAGGCQLQKLLLIVLIHSSAAVDIAHGQNADAASGSALPVSVVFRRIVH